MSVAIRTTVDQLPILSGVQGAAYQNRDGNFHIRRDVIPAPGVPSLSRAEFARIFGRLPPKGVNLRADLFFRLVRLGGLEVGFGPIGDPSFPDKRKGPLFRTYDSEKNQNDEAYGVFLNDEGNFNLQPIPHGGPAVGLGLCLSYDEFEKIFGFDSRDYFANEVVRIATLAGYEVQIRRKKR